MRDPIKILSRNNANSNQNQQFMMNYSPIAIKRSYVLGKIYNECDPIESIPVYLTDQLGELLGYVDESLGHYADAFIFNLSETVCKKLSSSYYDYAFGFEFFVQTMPTAAKKRIILHHILLIEKKTPEKNTFFKELLLMKDLH